LLGDLVDAPVVCSRRAAAAPLVEHPAVRVVLFLGEEPGECRLVSRAPRAQLGDRVLVGMVSSIQLASLRLSASCASLLDVLGAAALPLAAAHHPPCR